ncbi:MAG: hypothetical protein Kow0020_04760 [Wenzhouxiangellaceae bacterium]
MIPVPRARGVGGEWGWRDACFRPVVGWGQIQRLVHFLQRCFGRLDFAGTQPFRDAVGADPRPHRHRQQATHLGAVELNAATDDGETDRPHRGRAEQSERQAEQA